MRTIIFDFGNVIARFDHYRALRQLREFTSLTAEQIYPLIYDNDLEDRFEKGHLTSDQFLQHYLELGQLGCDAPTLQAAMEDIFTPIDEVCELAPRLKPRYRVLLGSNTNIIHSTYYRQHFAHVLKDFDGLVLSHEIGCRKPHPEFFHACLKLAECPAEECVFIDDLLVNIMGARAVGMKGIVYAPNQDLAGQLRELGVVI